MSLNWGERCQSLMKSSSPPSSRSPRRQGSLPRSIQIEPSGRAFDARGTALGSLLLAFLLSIATACHPSTGGGTGGGGTGGGGTGGGYSTVDAMCSDLPNKYCEYLIRCQAADALATCLGYYHRYFQPCAIEEKAGMKDGRISFDGAAAARRLSQLATADSCELAYSQDFKFDFKDSFVGLVANGGTCFFDSECAAASYCASSVSACPGTCQPRKEAGAATASYRNRECQEGLYNYAASRCLSPVEANGSCAAISPSTMLQTCASDHSCVGNACVPRVAAGGRCGDALQCELNLNCRHGLCAPASGLSQRCGQGVSCKHGYSCDLVELSSFSTGTCTAWKSVGGGCWSSSDCEVGLFCKDVRIPVSRGSCARLSALGEACNSNLPCSEGLYCRGGTCSPAQKRGEHCATTDECDSGLTCLSTCQPWYCADPTP